MRALAALLLATVTVALPTSCKSTASDIPCVCGTALGDLEGCVHPQCIEGEPHAGNPDCVCGGIEIPNTKKD